MAPNSTYGRKCGFIHVNMFEFRKASNNVKCNHMYTLECTVSRSVRTW